MTVVGTNARRYEGPDKVCGRAKYIDDHDFPGCLFGVTVRSSVAHGRIRRIDFDPKFPWSECVVATARDVPHNSVLLIEQDQPLLVDEIVRHAMEPIALIAHPRREKAYEALRHVHVEYEELKPALTLSQALGTEALIFAPDNVFKRFLIEKGDVEAGLRSSHFIVEGEYRVGHQEQAYIENNGMAAWWDNGGVSVMGSMQCPYYVHKAIKHMFGLPDEKVRVIQTATGGGFGGKEEYPNMIGGHAAVLARKAGRPVKIIYDRGEDMAATTKRHPAVVRHCTGLSRDGKLLTQDIEVIMDGGAYVTLSPVVLSRATLHAAGSYECPNVRVRSQVVATNTPPNGAFRGFGAPQTLFAVELHWEKIAQATGIDSLTLRRRNAFREGSITATGQHLRQSVGALETLECCVKRGGYERKRKEYERFNRDPKKKCWKGIGLALVHHGAGFTGSGEAHLASRAAISLTRQGEIKVLAASTEIGQGTNTLFAQIVADTLGVPYDWVAVEAADTGRVPNSGPTVASRTCMIVGGLLQQAAHLFKKEVVEARGSFPKTRKDMHLAAVSLCNGQPEKRFETQYQTPAHVHWDDKTYRGDAYGVYSYATVVADLEIDKTTFEVRVRKITTAQDIGKAINPLLAEGQIAGGTAQGVGYALYENVVMKGGVMANAQLTNYIIPTSLDTPPMDVVIIERPYSEGPFGAKGVGELPMDAPGPAIAAAIYQAAGLLISELPILPEKIAQAKSHDQADG
ncbi:MAG: hypothetical protein A3J74_01985 [Elusimicrobia bacterium RIFCSPHIGHO2_02_FULL_57_9]|nr:MAG: hypothetical protein A3J74_01985 [Elusimicrobia bacterium RIFCSPHIGHO2_02_FULL_57_9]